MAAIYNPDTVPYGSVKLTINMVEYIADDLTVTYSTKVIERTNELDEPLGQVLYKGWDTGSATLQLATAATAIPAVGDTFTYNSITWVINEVGTPLSKADYTKITISFREEPA